MNTLEDINQLRDSLSKVQQTMVSDESGAEEEMLIEQATIEMSKAVVLMKVLGEEGVLKEKDREKFEGLRRQMAS